MNEPVSDGFGRRNEHDRNGCGRPLKSLGSRRQDDVRLRLDQRRGELRQPFRATLCGAIIESEVVALDPAETAQCVAKTFEKLPGGGRQLTWPQHPNPRHLVRRLRGRPVLHGDGEKRERESADDRKAVHVWIAPALQEVRLGVAQVSLAISVRPVGAVRADRGL